jgi:FKBP-type peptidyl-prolyl cis-trans isomerase
LITKEETMTAELQIETIREGTGAEARSGNTVTVHYVGTLTDGKKFDSSRDRGKGFSFKLGAGQVIKGWDQGVAGMKVGTVRKLTIPPHLAYGERGFPGAIPPNSTLVFEVELLDVK